MKMWNEKYLQYLLNVTSLSTKNNSERKIPLRGLLAMVLETEILLNIVTTARETILCKGMQTESKRKSEIILYILKFIRTY